MRIITSRRPKTGAGYSQNTNAVGRLRRINDHTLFETSFVSPQLRLFEVGEVLGEAGG